MHCATQIQIPLLHLLKALPEAPPGTFIDPPEAPEEAPTTGTFIDLPEAPEEAFSWTFIDLPEAPEKASAGTFLDLLEATPEASAGAFTDLLEATPHVSAVTFAGSFLDLLEKTPQLYARPFFNPLKATSLHRAAPAAHFIGPTVTSPSSAETAVSIIAAGEKARGQGDPRRAVERVADMVKRARCDRTAANAAAIIQAAAKARGENI